MNKIFVDTSYFVALASDRDEFHLQAKSFSENNIRPLLTTTAIILELGAKFCRSDRRPIFREILEILRADGVEIVEVDSALADRGIDLFNGRPDKNWSLADCISFVVMGDRGILEAATSDEHFEQAQLVAVLRNPAEKAG